MGENKVLIAIDGPAASGKTTVARRLAQHFGFVLVESGAYYRFMAWGVLREGVSLSNVQQIEALSHTLSIEADFEGGALRLMTDGKWLDGELRSSEVSSAVADVAAIPAVRARVTAELHRAAERCDCVVEGRDIGSAVFPETPYKIYLDAPLHVRQQRRNAEGAQDAIAVRDRKDASRAVAPLIAADDAIRIEVGERTIEQVVEAALAALESRGLKL